MRRSKRMSDKKRLQRAERRLKIAIAKAIYWRAKSGPIQEFQQSNLTQEQRITLELTMAEAEADKYVTNCFSGIATPRFKFPFPVQVMSQA